MANNNNNKSSKKNKQLAPVEFPFRLSETETTTEAATAAATEWQISKAVGIAPGALELFV